MKTILVPVDFSGNSRDAVNYACMLAKHFNAEIVLCNSYQIPVYVTPETMENINDVILKDQSEKQMREEVSIVKKQFPEIEISSKVSWGITSDEIISTAKEVNADLIVMGSKGVTGLEYLLLGSNTVSVLKKSDFPVLAIPVGSKFSPIEKIGLATDFMDEELKIIPYLKQWVDLFRSKLSLIHVFDKIYNPNFQESIADNFKDKVGELIGSDKIEFHNLTDKNILQGLIQCSMQNNFQLLVLPHKKKSFLQNIFNTGFTNKIAHHPNCPLLIIPISNNI